MSSSRIPCSSFLLHVIRAGAPPLAAQSRATDSINCGKQFSLVSCYRFVLQFSSPPQALELEASLICLLIYRDSPSVNHCLPLSCHAEDRGYGQELFDEIPEKGNHLILQAIFLLVSTAKLYSCPITRNMRF